MYFRRGLAGFLFLGLLQTDSTTIILICLFSVTFVSAYIFSTGSAGISLLGLEIAYAFIIATTIMLDNGPVTHSSNIIYRLAGIMLGIFTIWVVNKLFWNENQKQIFDRQVKGYSGFFRGIRFPLVDKVYVLRIIRDLKIIKSFLNKLKAQQDITESEVTTHFEQLNIQKQFQKNRIFATCSFV